MKRIMAWILTMIFFLSASITAFAAEDDLDGENRQTDIGVYAQYIDNSEWNTVSVDENGQGTTALPDSIQITVSGVSEPGWQLVIDPITELEALNWIDGVLDGKATNLTPLHIFYIDESGNTKTTSGVNVTIMLAEKLNDHAVYSLTSEGKVFNLAVTTKDGKITFTTDGSPFYVLGEKVSEGTSTPSDDRGKTYTVQGTVKWNGQPVEGITIELHSTPRTTVTDENGKFSFSDVECGKHSLTAIENGKVVGYVEVILTESDAASLSLSDGIYTVTANKNEIGINLTLNLADDGTMSIASVTGVQDSGNSDGDNPDGDNPDGGNQNDTTSPQTGDNTNLLFCLVLIFIAFVGFRVIFAYNRKRKTGR